MWHLLMITLSFGTAEIKHPHVINVEVVATKHTQAKCNEYADKVKADMRQKGIELPKGKEMGCLYIQLSGRFVRDEVA